MTKTFGNLSDRLVSLFVPRLQASACCGRQLRQRRCLSGNFQSRVCNYDCYCNCQWTPWVTHCYNCC